jgi:TP901 family phage tail tape measure protein
MAVNIGPKIGIEGEAEYRKQINGIIQQSKTLASQMKALTTSFDKNGKSLTDNAKQYKILNEQIKTQEQKISAIKGMLDKSKAAYGENATETQKWQKAMYDAEAELNRLKSELDSLPSSLDMVAGKFADMGEKLESIGNKIADVGGKLTTAVTLPIVGAATKAVSSFAEVDKTMQLTNATMGNSVDEAEALNKAMEDAARNSTFGMSDAANASLNFARAGLTATEAANALAPAMNLAAGEGGELDTVSSGLVATINGFGDGFEKASDYADVFANACNNSALDIISLSESMSIAAPVFSAAGYSVNDAALYMGTMANAGIEASEAANSLKTGFSRLISPAKEGASWLKQFDWSVTDANGQMKDTVTIQKELHDKFAELSEAEQISAASAIFGKNQMSKWLALINTAPEEVQKLSDELKAQGTTSDMAEAMMSGFGGSIEKLKSSLDVLATSFGKIIAEYLTPMIEKVQTWLDTFNEMSKEEKDHIVKIAALAAAIGPLLMGGGKIIALIGKIMQFAPKIATLIQGASSALGGIGAGAGAALGPIAAIAAAIGVLVAAFMNLWKNNDSFREGMIGTWEGIKESFSGFISQIQERLPQIQEAFTNIMAVVGPMWDKFCQLLGPTFQAAFDFIKIVLDGILNAIIGVIDMLTGIFTGNKELFMQGLITFLTAIRDFVLNWWLLLYTWITNTINTVLGFFGTSLEEVIETVVTFFENLYETIIDKIKEIIEWLQEKWDSICEFFESLPDRFFQWGVDMIQGLIDGIKSMIGAVGDAIAEVAETIASYIHFSEPDKGPLSHFNSFMPDMMKQLAEGMEAGRFKVRVAAANVAADIAAPLGNTNNVTMNNSFSFTGGYTEADGRNIVRQINRQLGALYI